MRIDPFELERFFERHEFTAPYTLTSSDCEPLSLSGVLAMADAETLAMWDGMKLSYSEIEGMPLLRSEISGMYRGMEPGMIQVAAPEECIFLAMNAMLEPEDHVVATFPGYQSLFEIAGSIGCRVDRWEPEEEDGGWRFDVGGLARLVRPDTRAVVVNFPHNPTGSHLSRGELESVVEIARSSGARLFCDEMYRGLELDSETLPAGCELYEKAVSLSGMSKAFGLPGARVGWLATPDAELLEKVKVLREYTTICSSPVSELLSVMVLRRREKVVGANVEMLRRNLELLDSFFAEHEGLFHWTRPRAGTVAFPRVRFGAGATAFSEDLLRSAGVLMVPSPVFLYGDSHVRVGFGRKDMPVVLDRLREYMGRRTTA